MTRAIIAGFLLLAALAGAHAFGLGGEGVRFGKLGVSPKAGTASGGGGNALLLEDGSSILLLEDGSSFLCLEGGC
jgi:hypothetical protein